MTIKSKKPWKEKFEVPVKGLPKVVEVPENWQKRMGGKMILVPTPVLVDAVIQKVPKGKLITAGQIRKKLAADFKADSTCPLTLGIFLRIISEYMEEQRSKYLSLLAGHKGRRQTERKNPWRHGLPRKTPPTGRPPHHRPGRQVPRRRF
jgi:hypothetical protein